MKNFDLKLLNEDPLGERTEEWHAVWARIREEYLLCKSKLSPIFTKWSENGNFHDAYLLDIHPVAKKKGKWDVELMLEEYSHSCTLTIRYKDVSFFSIQNEDDDEFIWPYPDECLYAEFYKLDDKKVVHEFFTVHNTFVKICFSEMTCIKRLKK